jgi:predicted DNA-binding transcriptional regulator AlpA
MSSSILAPIDQESPFPFGLADDRVLTLSEFAKLAGISVVTLRRRIAAHDGPIVTKLSERRLGIRLRHAREWLDARASGNPRRREQC